MIAGRFDAVRAQQGRDLFHALARAAVNGIPALPPVFPKKAQQLRIAVVRPAHLKKQIRPVKAGQHGIGVFKLQQPRDIPAHGLRGRCGKCAYTRPPRQAAINGSICRYPGRKSCPHWLTQCASSTTTCAMSAPRAKLKKASVISLSGAT